MPRFSPRYSQSSGAYGRLAAPRGMPGMTSAASALGSTVLHTGQTLTRGQRLTSNNGHLTLSFQTDGNVVLYGGQRAIWASDTQGSAAQVLAMQSDGNLVLYGPGNSVLWAANTAGHPGAFAVLQDDGNFVIYVGQQALWSSRAAHRPNDALYALALL